MNPLFGATVRCDCGRTHAIRPEEAVFGPDALAQLPEWTARAAGPACAVAVLADARTREAAGAEAADALLASGFDVRPVLLPDPAPGRSPVCDDATKDALAAEWPACDVVLAVGSGVVSDLGKWIAFERDAPLLTFATAASMNGYASANVAPAVDGVKTLVRARPPLAVFADPAVLRAAPPEMTAAGLGDILAKSVSSADWRMNHLLFGDYYCERSVGLIADLEPLYLERPEALGAGEATALGALFEGLLLTGVAMTMAETSAPSSGGEHMLSHALDMKAAVDGTAHDLHGRQVGVGTILASEVYRRAFALERPDWRVPEPGVDAAYWGPLAGVVAAQSAEKESRLAEAAEALRRAATWDRLRTELAPLLRPPERIRDCLARAGAACRAEDLGIDREHLLSAFGRAHEIRSRFTILDLARLAGVLPGQARDIADVCGV